MTAMALTLHLEPSVAALRPTLGGVRAAFAPLPLSTEEWHAVDLVLMETLTNVVRHARPTGPIDVRLEAGARGLHVTVEDDGDPMPDGGLPEGALPDDDPTPDTAADHGYGWFLIRALARDIAYDRQGGRNRLTFRIAVGTGDG